MTKRKLVTDYLTMDALRIDTDLGLYANLFNEMLWDEWVDNGFYVTNVSIRVIHEAYPSEGYYGVRTGLMYWGNDPVMLFNQYGRSFEKTDIINIDETLVIRCTAAAMVALPSRPCLSPDTTVVASDFPWKL
jgi:hypothetical protein